jgi:hypothetical protein
VYSYCYVCSVLCILFHCVVLCTVCVYCTVLLLPGGNPIAVNKYIISYISYYIISYHFHGTRAFWTNSVKKKLTPNFVKIHRPVQSPTLCYRRPAITHVATCCSSQKAFFFFIKKLQTFSLTARTLQRTHNPLKMVAMPIRV